MKSVTEALPDATLVFVTHRISTLSYVDRVIMLEGGRLVAFDTVDALMHSNASFRDLVEKGSGPTQAAAQ